jgi:pyruvate ferredoxin oxidoreductase delta subunit
MTRPKLQPYSRPKHIGQFPTGTCFRAGHLVDTNAGWRTATPQLNPDLCTLCHQCYLLCPEGVIFEVEGKLEIDYDFCKGCGICAHECKPGAIRMGPAGMNEGGA